MKFYQLELLLCGGLLITAICLTLGFSEAKAQELELNGQMSTREWNEVDTEFQDKFIRYKEYHESWDRDTFPIDVEYKILTKENPAQSCINYLYSKFENKIVAEDLVLTFTDENRRWKIFEQSPDNEWGIPQLTYRLHKDFIESKYFADCYNQIDYAVDVYYDWKYRKGGASPRTGWGKRDNYKDTFEFTN